MKKVYNDIKIVTSDDHPVFLNGINSIIENTKGFKLLGTSTNGIELLNAYKQHKPDIILVDIKMPKMDGIDVVREIRLEDKDTGIVCLSGYGDKELISEMLEAGANGYVIKNADQNEIIETIIKVYNKERYLCRQTLDSVLKIPDFNPHRKIIKPHLSTKELEVVKWLCKRLHAKEIAKQMKISSRTVEQHKAHIQDKLNVENSLGIVLYAIKHRLVKLDDDTY